MAASTKTKGKAKSRKRFTRRKPGRRSADDTEQLKTWSLTLAQGGASAARIARKLAISRNTIAGWLKDDEQFEAKYEEARQASVEKVEDALYVAARQVVKDAKFTTAAIFYLKNRDPGNWRDVKDFRHSSGFREALEKLSPDKLRRLASGLESLEEIVEGEALEARPARKQIESKEVPP